MLKIAHIINPCTVKQTSDLFVAQPITFASMQAAQKFADSYDVDITLYSVQFSGERPLVPKGFQKTPNLERSVLDVGSFKIKRKLPLIKDILDRLYAATDADYFIYTNVDIAVMPNFYVTVKQIINQGYDALAINRRTIRKYEQVQDLPLMYAEIGQPHPGHDCFIFARSAYPKFELGSVCIGTIWFGKALLLNLICNSNKFKEFTDLHLTFHLGDDRPWLADELADYALHNKAELGKLIKHYQAIGRLADHPWVEAIASKMGSE